MNKTEKYKGIVAIDLFAGAGGLSRGFHDAGIHVIAGIDIDHTAKKTYEYNNSSKFIYKDIRDVTSQNIFDLLKGYEEYYYLLAGCAPCQAFSIRNSKQKEVDERRSLLLEFDRLIQETNPDFVFMENVLGIRKREPHVYETFEQTLHTKKYHVKADIVNAKYFEVAQERKRFVLFASKHHEITFPEKIIKNDSFLTVKDTIGHLPKLKSGEEDKNIVNHNATNLEKINIKRLNQTPHDGGSRSDWTNSKLIPNCHKNTKGFGNSYGRLAWNKPAPTITTRFYTYSSGRHGHPEQNRAMSFKEGALIQSFPNDYIFFGNSLQKGRQIGNAVPPKMAYHFGKHFLNSIPL